MWRISNRRRKKKKKKPTAKKRDCNKETRSTRDMHQDTSARADADLINKRHTGSGDAESDPVTLVSWRPRHRVRAVGLRGMRRSRRAIKESFSEWPRRPGATTLAVCVEGKRLLPAADVTAGCRDVTSSQASSQSSSQPPCVIRRRSGDNVLMLIYSVLQLHGGRRDSLLTNSWHLGRREVVFKDAVGGVTRAGDPESEM